MKKLLYIALAAVGLLALSSCMSDEESTWEKYRDWREQNNTWLLEQQARVDANGKPYFKTIVPKWNPGIYVLVHYFNDRELTEGNLSPLYNSTVDVRYQLHNCADVRLDSSLNINTYGPGIARFRLDNVIQGWVVAMSDMRCGDSAEIVVPYGAAYGAENSGLVAPYSNLRFNVRLVDIPNYQTN